MARIEPFEKHYQDYEEWFSENRYAYESELEAVRQLIPVDCKGLDIGVGSGRFAAPFGVKHGVDPSKEMARYARRLGIEVREGIAENLPYSDAEFDYALMVTTVCFIDDIESAMKEIYRILKPEGSLIIGLIDRESPLGNLYQKYKKDNPFYKIATFYSVDEILAQMRKGGFGNFVMRQTIFRSLNEINEREEVLAGYGKGSFVAVKGFKIKQ